MSRTLRRFPQHFDERVDPATLPEGGTEVWSERCCGLACVRTILHANGLVVPDQASMLRRGLEMGAYSERGWIHVGLLELARSYGLDGAVGTVQDVAALDALVDDGLLPVVSSTIRFPQDGRRGGHLVVFAGTTSAGDEWAVRFVDPSRWGAENDTVTADRFWASCTGRVIALWPPASPPTTDVLQHRGWEWAS